MLFIKSSLNRLVTIVSIIFMMSFASTQDWIELSIDVNPDNPTINDEVTITISGLTPSNLVEANSTFAIDGNHIFILTNVYIGNYDIVEEFEVSNEIGNLSLGEFQIMVTADYYQYDPNGNAEPIFTITGEEHFQVIDPEPLTGVFGNVWATNDWGIEMPVPGATIEALLENSETDPVFFTTTNENGYYELQLEPGFYTVTCSKEGLIPQSEGIEIGNAPAQLDFMLEHSYNTHWISGTVFGLGENDPDNPNEPFPLPGALVELLGLLNGEWAYIWETETNEIGYYEVPIMEFPAIYDGLALRSSTEGYYPQLQEIIHDDTEFPVIMDFYLEPISDFEAYLLGHVYSASDDASNMFPIGEAHVEIFDNNSSDLYADTFTDETGYYEFGEIASSATWIRVSAIGYVTQEMEIPQIDCNTGRCWPITMDFYLEQNEETIVFLHGLVGTYSENGEMIPIEGAYIAVPEEAGNYFHTTTDTDGFYEMEFPWMWNGPITIICEADGYYTQSVTVFPEDNSLEIEQNFILEPYQEPGEGVLAGFVTAQISPMGPEFPVVGAIMGATPTWGPEPWLETSTDENGYYEIELWANQAPWHVFCTTEYGSQEEFAVIQPNEVTELNFHFNAWEQEFPPPFDLTATLMDDEAAVYLHWQYEYDFPGSELMHFNVYANLGEDSDIPWLFIGTAEETNFVHYLMTPGENITGEICYKVTAVELDTNLETEPSNIACVTLDPPENSVLYGHVTGGSCWECDDWHDLAGATITVFAENSDIVFGVATDEEGNYELELPAGYYVVTAEHPEFPSQTHTIHIEPNTENELNFILLLENGFSQLFGNVIWQTPNGNQPIADAHIIAYPDSVTSVFEAFSNENGHYAMEVTANTHYFVVCSFSTAEMEWSQTQEIFVGYEPSELNFIFGEEPPMEASIFGFVGIAAPNGDVEPVSGAQIIATCSESGEIYEATTDENGHYEMLVFPNSLYVVSCQLEGVTQSQEVFVHEAPVQITFIFGEEPQFGLLTGNVRSVCDLPEWWDCPPISGALVYVHNAMFETEIHTNDEGYFEVMLPPAGGYSSYQLHVMAEGFEDYHYSDLIEIYPNQETHVDINMSPLYENNGSISGFVYQEETDSPIPGIEVNLFGEDNWCGYNTTTDDNGYYFIEDICSGQYTIEVFADGYEHYEHEHIMIYPGEETNFDVFLTPISDYPDWVVDVHAYEFNMALAGLLYFDGEESFDENDLLGAFVGEECRGVAQPTYFPLTERYTVNMMIYSNLTEGELVSFKAFDNSESIVYENVIEALEFQADGIIGNDLEPFEIHAVSTITMSMEYSEGWNWFSLNLINEDMSLNTVLESLGSNASFIKNQDGYANYYDDYGWYGLETFDSMSMYMILVNASTGFAFDGYPINLEENYIPLSEGWNWISYFPQHSLSLDDALNSIEPNGVFIKNQFAYANYYAYYGWYGLEVMEPGGGYMLLVGEVSELIYPTPFIRLSKTDKHNNYNWTVNPHQYEYNMALTCIVENGDDFVVAAFVGDEIRGVAKPTYFPPENRNTVNLTIYGSAIGEDISFKIFDENTNEVFNVLESIEFEINGIIGDDFEPKLLRIKHEIPTDFVLNQNYPNPFNPVTTISYQLPTDVNLSVSVFDVQGRIVDNLVEMSMQKAGYHSVVWNAEGFASGLYIVTIESDKYFTTQKVLLMK